MSREWLLSLRTGDVILVQRQGHEERLEVIQDYSSRKIKRERVCVLIKRPHLKTPLHLTEEGNCVGFQWSCKIGKEHCDFSEWEVVKN